MLDPKLIRSDMARVKRGLIARSMFDIDENIIKLYKNKLGEKSVEEINQFYKTTAGIKFLMENESEVTISHLNGFIKLDEERREVIKEVEDLKCQQNRANAEISAAKKTGADVKAKLEEMKAISEKVKILDAKQSEIEKKIEEVVLYLPNICHETTPVGASGDDNVEIRRWGTPAKFSFEPLSHADIGVKLDILDFDRAAKITGARFTVLKGDAARLERALISFMIDVHTGENGYHEVLPPYAVNRDSMRGTGQLPKFEEDLFKVNPSGYYLIPTAEVPVTNLHRDEMLNFEALPVKYVSFTPCFRAEAGSYGKDMKGLIRQHQFHKVELVKFTAPETSYEEHEKLVADAEKILQKLKLPYRVMALSTGDIGFSAAKCYDLEVWLPSQNTYREISSCSNFEDFQSRRAQIRFKRNAKAKPELAHTINGSGLAIGRTLIAIMENYQNEDGSVTVPEVLIPYMGGMTKIGAFKGYSQGQQQASQPKETNAKAMTNK